MSPSSPRCSRWAPTGRSPAGAVDPAGVLEASDARRDARPARVRPLAVEPLADLELDRGRVLLPGEGLAAVGAVRDVGAAPEGEGALAAVGTADQRHDSPSCRSPGPQDGPGGHERL